MRLKYLILILLLLVCFQGYSQVKPFRFGVEATPLLSWISTDSDGYKNEGVKAGFTWGFLADVTLTENYFLKTGFNMEYLGGTYSYPDQIVEGGSVPITIPGTTYRDIKLKYIELPISLKMRTNPFGKTAFFGDIGFGTAINLKAKASDEFKPDEGGSTLEEETDAKDEVAMFRGSLIVGAGAEYFIDKSTSLIFSISYNNGLTNILTGENPVNGGVKQRARLDYIQLNIGIIF